MLQTLAQEHQLDALVSADGDGDRPLVADEKGVPVRGDLLGLVTARFLGAEVLVTPVTSNSGIEAAGSFKVVRTKVGSPYVIAAMQEAVAAGQAGVVGFEANGGFLTASDFSFGRETIRALPTRDCLLPILAILALRVERQAPMSEIAASFNLPVAAADRLENFSTEGSTALMAHLRASDSNLSDFLRSVGEVQDKTDIDGLRVALDGGRIIHFRPSGNAPEMRCYVEAASKEKAEELLGCGLELIKQWTPGERA